MLRLTSTQRLPARLAGNPAQGGLAAKAASLACAAVVALVALVAVPSIPRSVPAQGDALAIGVSGGLPYVSGQVVVGYRGAASSLGVSRSLTMLHRTTGVTLHPFAAVDASTEVLSLPKGVDVPSLAARIRQLPGIAYAVPNYIAHTAGAWVPDDPGSSHRAGGWQAVQWNFGATDGVNAPEAWANLGAEGHLGASGVTIAVIDTGVAFQTWGGFERSPDFKGTHFVSPCDLVSGRLRNGRCTDPHPLDREGHGTFVAGVIAEATNNRVGLTGLAYGADVMPIRVLNARGLGSSSAIAQGIRYAVKHGAQVINLSLEFYLGVTARDIPEIVAAIDYAHRQGVVVVGAAGNDGSKQIAYPARVPTVISVGATTSDRCLASYSDVGAQLDIVAPGGGQDSSALKDPNCDPSRSLPDVYQMTFNTQGHPNGFGMPSGWFGTSMAAPDVAAGAAMVIASGVIGPHPTPDQILARLEQTADPMGGAAPNPDYGYGLLNLGAATSPTVPPYSL